jgi:hypothetical protein
VAKKEQGQKAVNRWYPNKSDFPDDKQFEVVRQLTDLIYGQQSQLAALQSSHDSMQEKLNTHGSRMDKVEKAGGPSTTKITGLFVKAVPPTNGQTLKYNAASGQVEWS